MKIKPICLFDVNIDLLPNIFDSKCVWVREVDLPLNTTIQFFDDLNGNKSAKQVVICEGMRIESDFPVINALEVLYLYSDKIRSKTQYIHQENGIEWQIEILTKNKNLIAVAEPLNTSRVNEIDLPRWISQKI